MIDGTLYPIALNRVPQPGGLGNLMQQATAHAVTVNARDKEVIAHIGPQLRAHGVRFAGVDIIGSWVSEINITCPTGIAHIKQLANHDIAAALLDALDANSSHATQ